MRNCRRLVVVAAVLAAVGTGTAAGAAFSATSTPGPTRAAARTLAAPTGAAIAWSPDVSLSWTATTSAFAAGYRVTRSISSAGPFTAVADVTGRLTTTYTDSPGAGSFYYRLQSYAGAWSSPATATLSRVDPTYVFGGGGGFTGTNCASAQVLRDMAQGYSPAGPEQSHTRTAGVGTATFCTDAYSAGQSVPAGTTVVSAHLDNGAGSGCGVTVTVLLNGVTALGTGSVTVPQFAGRQPFTISVPTTGAVFAAGDRLNVKFDWQAVKACASTNLFWNSAAAPSQVTFPG